MRLKGFGSIKKRRQGGWQIRYYVRGEEIRESVARALGRPTQECSEKQARDLLAQRLGEIQTGRYVRPSVFTLDAALEHYLAGLRLEGAKSVKKTTCTVGLIKRELGATLPVRELTAPVIKRWADKLLALRSVGTVQQRCAHLKAALHLAHRDQLIGILPAFPQFRLNNARQGFFEPGEVEQLLPHLPEHLRDVVVFAYLTGWRKSEILGLTWAQVDRQRRQIRLVDTKNGEGRDLPLVGDIGTLLEARWRARVVGTSIVQWVFHRQGRPIKNFLRSWNTACKDAGLPGRIFHDFRRTAARDLVEAGNDYRAAMSVTGHRSLTVFMRYRIVDRATTERALQRMAASRRSVIEAKTDNPGGQSVRKIGQAVENERQAV